MSQTTPGLCKWVCDAHATLSRQSWMFGYQWLECRPVNIRKIRNIPCFALSPAGSTPVTNWKIILKSKKIFSEFYDIFQRKCVKIPLKWGVVHLRISPDKKVMIFKSKLSKTSEIRTCILVGLFRPTKWYFQIFKHFSLNFLEIPFPERYYLWFFDTEWVWGDFSNFDTPCHSHALPVAQSVWTWKFIPSNSDFLRYWKYF